jgi:type VI secretion system protein ImpF
MAELTPMDRLQPCLLDRLTDDEPEVSRESRDQRIVSLQRYKSAVLRDIEMILNAKRHPSHNNIYEFREAARSVLNFGILDICGTPILNAKPAEIESHVKEAIICFEPRISQRTLSVRMVSPLNSEYIRSISFEIEAELWAQPLPDRLFVKTEVDLETGHYKLKGELNG